MKKKKLTIIFGGPVGSYNDRHNTLFIIDKLTGCTLKRIAPEKFVGELDGVKLEVRFCWQPTRDDQYERTKRIAETKWKEIMAIPADELVKKIKKTDGVLLLGLCGAFNGKKGYIHLPNELKELRFKKSIIKHKEILKIKPKNLIKIKNDLIGSMYGRPARSVTSNLTLAPFNIENESEEHLAKLAKSLSKSGDVVEKESYEIAKAFKNKHPLGIMLMTSDVLKFKKHMMPSEGFTFDDKKFGGACAEAIKVMVNKLK